MAKGIDYGRGQTNIDHATGIRYGCISQHSVLQAWADSAEPDYGSPHCPQCGREADKPEDFGDTFADGRPEDYTDTSYEMDEYVCVECKHFFGSESAFGDEPIGWTLDDGEYQAVDCLNTDILITKSPYFTYAPFCSPCVPGAGNLDSADDDGVKTYCFGHDWFDDGKAPYRVFRVTDGAEVLPE
jgi:hypothetical protein